MIAFIVDNLATLIISVALLAVVVQISVNLIKKKKSGKAVGCSYSYSYGCNTCPSASLCHKH